MGCTFMVLLVKCSHLSRASYGSTENSSLTWKKQTKPFTTHCISGTPSSGTAYQE
uniref:Uncharacterized protein n=1 Tax=Anguilla anguilla TaxID=7936 RepID=A0A0E9SWM1_ANGAN